MNLKSSLAKHLPEIMTGLGIASFITGTVLAVKATPKAKEHLERCTPKDESKKQRAKDICTMVLPCYAPTILFEVGGVVLVSMALGKCLKRNAALSIMLAGAQSTIDLTEKKLVEKFGEEVAGEIKKEVAQENVKANVKDPIFYPKGTSDGQLYIDGTTGRKFVMEPAILHDIVNRLNEDLMVDHEVSLNDLYYRIGLRSTILGEYLWFLIEDGLIRLKEESIILDSGESAIVLDFMVRPKTRHMY